LPPKKKKNFAAQSNKFAAHFTNSHYFLIYFQLPCIETVWFLDDKCHINVKFNL
jgi:hypothetical protein